MDQEQQPKPSPGRPGTPLELVEEVERMARDGKPQSEAVEKMKGRMGHNKVYEIYRYAHKAVVL